MIHPDSITVNSVSEYDWQIDQMCGDRRKPYRAFFRGQADAGWTLQSRLRRFIESEFGSKVLGDVYQARLVEKSLINAFRSEVEGSPELGISLTDTREWPWFAIMQHYGVPTRFIDFSWDEHIAAYFASSDEPDRDGLVFLLTERCGHYLNEDQGDWVDEIGRTGKYIDQVVFFDRPANCRDMRMDNQKALFASCFTPIDDFVNCMRWKDPKALARYVKITIPKDAKPGFLADLRKSGIDCDHIYPQSGLNIEIESRKNGIVKMAICNVLKTIKENGWA